MFAPDDLVVYPAQGVGKIEGIDNRAIGNIACEFYIVRIRANNVTLMVPVSNAANVGLRTLCASEAAGGILDSLRSGADKVVHTGQNWNRRFREYSERLKSPDLAVVAEVLRELLLIGRLKELSFGERRLQEQAMGLVAGELAEVLQLTEGTLREELLQIYAPTPAEVPEPKGEGSATGTASAGGTSGKARIDGPAEGHTEARASVQGEARITGRLLH